jgi:hypothetical protein
VGALADVIVVDGDLDRDVSRLAEARDTRHVLIGVREGAARGRAFGR